MHLYLDPPVLDNIVFMDGNPGGGGSGGGPSGGGPEGRPPESSSSHGLSTVSEANRKKKEDLDSAMEDLKDIARLRTEMQLAEGKIRQGPEAVNFYNNQLRSVFNESVKEIATESKKRFTQVEDYRALFCRIDRIINPGQKR